MGTLIAKCRAIFVLLCALCVLCAGCGGADPSSEGPDFALTGPQASPQSLVDDVVQDFQSNNWDDVNVFVINTGTNEHIIVATAILETAIGDVWSEIRDFEQLGNIGLPGVVTDFEWLNGGGPEQIPSTFQFLAGTALVIEEIYYRNEDTRTLRYRLLVPALGIQEYDAQITLVPLGEDEALFISIRDVTLDPGVLDGLVDLIELETTNIRDYFANP